MDEASVAELMSECPCTRERAVSLLELYPNDVTRAKHHYQVYSSYLGSLPTGAAPTNGRHIDSRDAPNPESPASGAFRRRGSPDSGSRVGAAGLLTSDPRPLDPPGWSSLGATAARPETPKPDKLAAMENHEHPLAFLPRPAAPDSSAINMEQRNDGRATPPDHSRKEGEKPASLEPAEWDFVLPHVPHPGQLLPKMGDNQIAGKDESGFGVESLAGAVLHEADTQAVSRYLACYSERTVKRYLQAEVQGFPSIFYAVGSNNVDILRLWVSYGASTSAVHEPSGTPLLAFAIVHGGNISGDTTAMVATLLSLGASPRTIPEALYRDFDNNKDFGEAPEPTGETTWCTDAAHKKLVRSLNLTHAYLLSRSMKMKAASVRHRQVAALRDAEPILGVPYFLVGQTVAAGRLVQKLLSHLMLPSRRPLVLLFAGPSGHGKTELARRMGHLLSLPLEVVDCTIVNREMELFGPRHPYTGAERGSPLNNFLASNAGQRCVVFLDEFEKTTKDIHQALLLPFDNGEYQDRRDLSKVDCSNTVWILATNALDDTITAFCDQNPQVFNSEGAERDLLIRGLSKALRASFLQQFDAPITGRMSDFIPFLPFSPIEQAVVAHKFLLELANEVRAPVKLPKTSSTLPNEQLLGNINLLIGRGAAVCKRLATDYSPDLGARSMITAVETVKELLMDAYLEENEEIVEDGVMRDFVVDVHDGEVVVRRVKDERNAGARMVFKGPDGQKVSRIRF